jgi:hypothetical protein
LISKKHDIEKVNRKKDSVVGLLDGGKKVWFLRLQGIYFAAKYLRTVQGVG